MEYKERDGWHIISTYSDAQALADGVLISAGKGDRITAAVWSWLEQNANGPNPPNRWPVPTEYFHAKDNKGRAMAMAKGILSKYFKNAIDTYNRNINGGIFRLWARESGLKIFGLSDTEIADGRVLWVMPNENNGVTLMFPDDY
jgi:hypothetical protein